MIPKIAILYCSRTDNTKQLANLVCESLQERNYTPSIFQTEKLPINFSLEDFDIVLVGTFSWGKGDIPKEIKQIYKDFENLECKHITTGVFGTGDRFYPNFCGAVDRFRDMLFVQTNLAVTLKVELSPQKKDEEKCRIFVEKIIDNFQKSRVA